jgi:hypothetical protein
MNSQNDIIIKIATDQWLRQVSRASTLFDEYTDEQLSAPIAPNKNSGVYLLGHLTAVHDALFPLLGFDDKLYPDLFDVFVKNPDSAGIPKPAVADLRKYWQQVTKILNEKILSLSYNQWMERHTSISPEDFEKEPHRNRLSVLLSRTTHLTEHIGQLLWVKK